MNVKSLSIDWMLAWGNYPDLKVELTDVPAYKDFRFKHHPEEGRDLYVAELEGMVLGYAHTSYEEGYGGRIFNLPMEDGSVKQIKGPWSGGSYCYNRYLPSPAIEIIYTDAGGYSTAGMMLISLLEPHLPESVEFYLTSFGFYVVTLKGKTPEESKQYLRELKGILV